MSITNLRPATSSIPLQASRVPSGQWRVLVTKTWRDHWRGLIGWAFGFSAIIAIQLAVYPSVRKSSEATAGLIDAMPDAMKQVFRMVDYTSGPGYLSAELFSLMLPLSFIAIGITWGTGATAGEEDRGTADVLLALPVRRATVVVSKLVAMVTAMLALSVLVCFDLVIGTRLIDMQVSVSGLLAASVSVCVLGILFGSAALLIGCFTGKRGLASGLSVALAIAAFLLYSLGPLVDALDPWIRFSPFQWTVGTDPLRTGLDLAYTALTLMVAGLVSWVAVLLFKRRDIGT